jgi:hypothetical protein
MPYIISTTAARGRRPPRTGRSIAFHYVGDGNHNPIAVASADPLVGDAPLTIDFSAVGSADIDGDDLIYRWDFGDGPRKGPVFWSSTPTTCSIPTLRVCAWMTAMAGSTSRRWISWAALHRSPDLRTAGRHDVQC